MRRKLLPLLFLLGLFSFSIKAQDVITLTATTVAEISEGDPDADQDDADLMIQSVAGGSFQSFIMFDVSSTSGEIGSASLNLP